jgi:hypothetical protein
MFTLSEPHARLWSTIFGGITSIGLILAGLYALVQYFAAAKQPFYSKQLELYVEVMDAAGTLADSKDDKQIQDANASFRRLYWGPLAALEDANVEDAMVRFKQCLDGPCQDDRDGNKIKSLQFYALELSHQCRASISKSWTIPLPQLPERKEEH